MPQPLRVPLGQLHATAVGNVPRLGDHYADISGQLGGLAGDANESMGAVAAPWDSVCNRLQQSLATSSGNIYDAGSNLEKAATNFADNDEKNSAMIERQKWLFNNMPEDYRGPLGENQQTDPDYSHPLSPHEPHADAIGPDTTEGPRALRPPETDLDHLETDPELQNQLSHWKKN